MYRTLILCLLLPLPARADDKRDHFTDGARNFRDVMEHLKSDYLDDLSDDDFYRAAVAGMLSAGGRSWDQLLSPSEMAALRGDLAGEVVGVGIELKLDEATQSLVVARVLDGAPADKGGIVAGDQLLQIDGKPVVGRPMMDVVRTIRGAAGTAIQLTMLHAGQVVVRSLHRDKVVLAPVGEEDLGDGVALIKLRSFNEKTPALLEQALRAASARHARGLVLDVRGNPGGLFDAMVACAGMLLPRGATVAQLERRGGAVETIRTGRDPVLAGVPIVVVANPSTASGAEILAGALRDGLGARVIGSKTFGKWNVQRIDELPNGWAIKYTTGRFRTARGEALDGKGLIPDLEVEPGAADSAHHDGQLRAAAALLKLSR